MNIDLLFSKEHEAGLIADQNFVQKAIGVTYDPQTTLMGIEFADMDILDLNIPLDTVFGQALDHCPKLYIGSIVKGKIIQAYRVPLMFLDDPYRANAMMQQSRDDSSLQRFSHFVKNCTVGQPVHRDDLGNEDAQGCVLGDASPAALQFAPHLERQYGLEVKPQAAPSAPGFSAPGLGGSGTSRTTHYRGTSDDTAGDDE